jgi:hypothetical protein
MIMSTCSVYVSSNEDHDQEQKCSVYVASVRCMVTGRFSARWQINEFPCLVSFLRERKHLKWNLK